MGNHASGGLEGAPAPAASATSGAEPLEAYAREQQRDEHLKNLGFKRSRSLRKSISKRLRRKRRDDGGASATDEVDANRAQQATTAATTTATTIEAERPAPAPTPSSASASAASIPRHQRPLVGAKPEPLPTHVQVKERLSW